MNRLRLAALLLLVTAAGAVAGDSLFDALWQRPRASGVIIVPDTYLRRWDPVTVFFPTARGKPGPEDNPERFVAVEPPHPGAYTWLDAHTLQFKPADPWPALTRYTWTAGTAKASLATLLAPPAYTDPSDGQTDLPPVDRIELAFEDPTPASVLARMIQIELRPLPGVAGAPRHLAAADFTVKQQPRPERGKHRYTIRLARPIERGMRATLRLGLAAADVGADDQAVSQVTFATAPPFRVESLGCNSGRLPVTPTGTRYPADQPLRCESGYRQGAIVQFSAEPKALGPVLGRDLVRFEPAVRGLEFELSGRQLTISGDFEPDQAYRMAVVPAPIFDTAGRALEIDGESAVWLSFAPSPRVLRWDAAAGLAERFGPKRVPVRVRGHAKADLRIYRLDPLNRAFWPFDETVEVDESLRPPGPGEEPAAWTGPDPIDHPSLRLQLRALGAPGVSTLVDLPDSDAERRGLELTPHLDGLIGKDAPGHFLVGLRALDADERSWMRLQVTDLSLTSVEGARETRFYVTSLAKAAPVAGATIVIEGASGTGKSRAWARLWSGRTGADGGVTWVAPGKQAEAPQVRRIMVSKGDDLLVLDPQAPPEAFAFGYWASRGAWLGWVYDLIAKRGEQARIQAHLFSERPIYRPDHAVHLKAWVRRAHQGRFEAVSGKATLVVQGPGGANWRLPVELSAFGTAYAKFEEADKPTGIYTAWLEQAKDTRLAEVTFKVEAYRLPTFKVGLLGPDAVPLDAPFDVAALGTYYAGGRVSERPVRWRVTQYPYRWSPKGPAGFVYSVDGRYARESRFEATPALTQAGLTDLDGRVGLTLDPTIEPTAQPRTYVIEATVTGADDQTVTATRRVRAVPGFALGLKVPRYVERGGRIAGEVIAVDQTGKPRIGQPLTVIVKHRQWHAHLKATDFSEGEAKYVTDTVDVEIKRLQLTSAAEPLPLDVTVPRAGVYIVEVESHDALGRAQVVRNDLYVGGDEPVSWPKPENKSFVATPDKQKYAPGETANVVLQSPFQTAEALVVVEGPEANTYRWVPVRGGKAVVKVALDREATPRLPVHVILLRGRSEAAAPTGMTTLDLGRPEAVATTVNLDIEPIEHTLTVSVENPEKALPGKTIPLTVRLKTHTGAPASGEVTLWLVDQAVLDLAEEAELDPIDHFVEARGSFVSLRDTRRMVFGRIPFAVMPGGGDGENDDDPFAKATVRRDFRPVPYYEPALQIGKEGVAQVQVKLPDNLTRFAIRAKAISTDRFGFAKGHVDVRLPVVAQPALPRFVRAGDRFTAGLVGRVVEGEGGAGEALMKADGGSMAVSKAEVTFGRTGTVRADFPITVEAPAGSALVVTSVIARTSDGAKDAAEIRLPIRADRDPKVQRRVLALSGASTLPAVAEGARPGTLERRLTVATHPAVARAAGAVDSLRHRPDGATDGRLAQARVFLAAGALRTILGFADDAPPIQQMVRDMVAWLNQCVDGQGRIAPFPGTAGQIHLTAEALLFLVEAKEAGFAATPQLQARLKETLRKALRSDYAGFLDGSSWTERTRALEALAAAGALDAAYLNEFVSRGRGLGAPHAARVLLAARSGDRLDAVGAALGKTLHDAVRLQLKEGAPVYAGLAGYSMSHPLIGASEATAMAVVHRGLAISPLASDRLPPLEAALLSLGDDGGWGGPRADAEALFAVSDLLERGTDATVNLQVGAQRVTLKPGEAIAAVDLDTADAIALNAEGGSAHAVEIVRAVPLAPGSAEAAEASGFVVKRDGFRVPADQPLQRIDLPAPDTTVALKIGEVVEEHVQITNPELRHYVAVTLPLAAGVEPLNPALKTAPPEAKLHHRPTLEPDYVRVLDDRVVWYFVTLPKGAFDLYIRTRATVAGDFTQPAARAEALLTPAVRGNSVGAKVTVAR